MTGEDILKSWDDNRDAAASAGTQTHYNIECFYNGIDVVDDSVEFKYFKEFVRDHPHLEAYRTEWCVFYEEIKVSGSIDMVFRDKNTGEYLIYDWKRSKGIEYESYGGKTAITPCISHLPDTNFWHYSLQLNVYRKILQDKYDMKIARMALVVLHPDNQNKTYEVVEVPVLDKEMEDLWKTRSP
jgi:ATP-dependent exoDNAse (exonuclease V) beta subunit